VKRNYVFLLARMEILIGEQRFNRCLQYIPAAAAVDRYTGGGLEVLRVRPYLLEKNGSDYPDEADLNLK